nr:SprT family zinc-dependent metalloprotease [Geotalea sp. SG265]
MEIAVHPDGRVVVKAPVGTEFDVVRQRVVKRAGWVKRQLEYFRQFEPRTPPRRYLGGETHLYLGKRYILKVSEGDSNEVKLNRGHIAVTTAETTSAERVRHLLDQWYKQKAVAKFNDSFDRCWPPFASMLAIKPKIQLRHMNKRWGSLSKRGTLTLNTELIRAPRECIDYVITHELCHVQYHNHSSTFYDLLEKVMPDWEKRKHRLELSLV